MTAKNKPENSIAKRLKPALGIMTILLLVSPAFLFPKEISDGIYSGIKLCVTNVIPSVFPFFIISDAIFVFSDSLGESFMGRLFSRIFNLPSAAASAFITGSICGFPLGVKVSSDLYEKGMITRKEAERLIGFSNNPSAAFVTTAVGLGMLGDVKLGFLLYGTVIISAFLTGVIFRGSKHILSKTSIISRQKFDFVLSVKNAGLSSLTVSSYIIFFSALSGLFLNLFGDGILGLIGVMLAEVSGGAAFIACCPYFEKKIAFVLIAVTLAFSGFSVHLQARSLASKKLSFIKYYVMKTVQACISGLLALLSATIFI